MHKGRSLAHRGASPEAILKAERGWRSRGCARNAGSGGSETVPRALRPGCEELAVRSPEEMLETDASDPNRKIARWSAERRARLRQVGVAPRQRDQSMRRSALRRPSSGGKRRFKIRAPPRRGNEEGCADGRSGQAGKRQGGKRALVRTGFALAGPFWPNKANRRFWPNKANRRCARPDDGLRPGRAGSRVPSGTFRYPLSRVAGTA